MADCTDTGLSGCVDELGSHVILAGCDPWRKGGYRNAILYLCGHGVTDFSNATEIEAAVTAGTAKKIANAQFGLDARSEVTQQAPMACAPETITNYTGTGTFLDANVSANNIAFYETLLSGTTTVAVQLFECGNEVSPQTYVLQVEMSWRGALILPTTDDEYARFEGTFNYKSLKLPTMVATPAGIF